MTRFVWDGAKAANNLRKHRVSFEEACTIFADSNILTIPDDEHSNEEDRWVSLGVSSRLRILLVVHLWPEQSESGEEVIRIISARRANARERRDYEDRLP